MKYRYIGCGVEDPQTTVFYGMEFTLNGDPVDVTDSLALKKIAGNQTFAKVGPAVEEAPVIEDSPAVEEAPAEDAPVEKPKKIGRPRKVKA